MMKLGMKLGLGSGHIVLDGDPAPTQKGHSPPPQFSAHVHVTWAEAKWHLGPLAMDMD